MSDDKDQTLTSLRKNIDAIKPPRSAGPYGSFSGERGLALGSVMGHRKFSVDYKQRLVGITFPEVFRPGWNDAECGSRGIKLHRNDQHDMSHRDHTCGYYAYFDEFENEYGSGYVDAVIEGSGETLIGTKGFRTARARLVALSVKNSTRKVYKPRWYTKFFLPRDVWGLYSRFDGPGILISVLAVVFGVGAFITSLVGIIGLTSVQDPADTTDYGLVLRIGLLLFLPTIYGLVSWRTDKAVWRRPQRHHDVDKNAIDLAERLRVLYPGVPVYSSRKQMLKKHPASKADDFKEPVIPDTPETNPNFWN